MSGAPEIEIGVRDVYDNYWPSHLPSKEDLDETRKHLYKIIPTNRWGLVLDGGCGLGVCSVVLSEMSDKVVGLDISPKSLRAASNLAKHLGKKNIEFSEGSLMDIPFNDETFDLILCWGV